MSARKPKYEEFCRPYVRTFNAGEAAGRHEPGHRRLRRPAVAALVHVGRVPGVAVPAPESIKRVHKVRRRGEAVSSSTSCPAGVQRMSSARPDSVHKMSRKCPEDVQTLSRECPDPVQRMSRRCQDDARDLRRQNRPRTVPHAVRGSSAPRRSLARISSVSRRASSRNDDFRRQMTMSDDV